MTVAASLSLEISFKIPIFSRQSNFASPSIQNIKMSTNTIIGVKRSAEEPLVDPRGIKYRIGEKIAEGLYSTVHVVHMIGTDTLFPQSGEWVYKRSSTRHADLSLVKKPFTNEAEVLKKINSRGDFCSQIQSQPVDLRTVVNANGATEEYGYLTPRMDGDLYQPPIKLEISTYYKILTGLFQIQQLNILHLDIKNDNILHIKSGDNVNIRFIDFGIAMCLDASKANTREYIINVFNLFFRAYTTVTIADLKKGKELLINWRSGGYDEFVPLLKKMQTFAVGIVLYNLITKTRLYPFKTFKPLPKESPQEWDNFVKSRVLDTDQPKSSESVYDELIEAKVDQRLAKFISKMVSLDPSERPTPSELKEMLIN